MGKATIYLIDRKKNMGKSCSELKFIGLDFILNCVKCTKTTLRDWKKNYIKFQLVNLKALDEIREWLLTGQ